MSGRSSRRKGHGYEVRCAHELTEATGLDVRTTRSLGASYGADLATVTAYDAHGRPASHIPTVLGWSVECKSVAVRNPGTWLRQAIMQAAPGATPVVLWCRKHYPFGKGSAFVYDVTASRDWRETTIDEWLEALTREADDVRTA